MTARDALSAVSGLKPAVVDEIWEKVKSNAKTLDACAGPHEFVEMTPGKLARGGRAEGPPMKQAAAVLLVLFGIALCVAACAFFAAIYGCAPVKVGPFPEPGAKLCWAESDCAPGTKCRFQRVGSHATCVRAGRGYDDVMDNMPSEPAP